MEEIVMEKLHQDIKSMVEQVAIPDQKLNDTVQNALFKAKRKDKRNFFTTPNVVATIASVVVLTFGALLYTSYDQSVNGQNETSVMFNLGDEGLQRLVKEGYVQTLSLEAEDQGVKVVLNEGYLDNYQLAVSFQIETDNQKIVTPEKTEISYEWFLEGKSIGPTGIGGWSGILTEEFINKGEIFTYLETEDFPTISDLELKIYSINEVEGDWHFQFQLDKEQEHIVSNDLIEASDKLGNTFQIYQAELTPSQLVMKTNARLLVHDPDSEYREYELAVIGIGEDGTKYLTGSMSSSTYDTPKIEKYQEFYRRIEIPRGVNVYSYEVVPYIATYRGEEVPVEHGKAYNIYKHTVPFAEGEVLGAESPIKVEKIREDSDKIIVTYKMDLSLPVFPSIQNRDTEKAFYPISFKQRGNSVDVTYPKVKASNNLELYMYQATYQTFPNLKTRIDLK